MSNTNDGAAETHFIPVPEELLSQWRQIANEAREKLEDIARVGAEDRILSLADLTLLNLVVEAQIRVDELDQSIRHHVKYGQIDLLELLEATVAPEPLPTSKKDRVLNALRSTVGKGTNCTSS